MTPHPTPHNVLQVSFILVTLIFQVCACLSVVFHRSVWKVCVCVCLDLLSHVSCCRCHTLAQVRFQQVKSLTLDALINKHTLNCNSSRTQNLYSHYAVCCILVYINTIFHFLTSEDRLMLNLNLHEASLIG